MKPNRFRQVVKEGRIPIGTLVWEFGTRGMPKILEAADLDRVEHALVALLARSGLVWVIATLRSDFLHRLPELPALLDTLCDRLSNLESGEVALIYPHMNMQTRTARIRIELPNPDELLRPDMYADIEIATGAEKPAKKETQPLMNPTAGWYASRK